MSGWLARAATDAAMRGEEPRNRFARWTARWLAPTPVVPESRFQDADEPFPGHWRRFPERWPASPSLDSDVRAALIAAIDELPATWRDVLVARDVLGRGPAEVERLVGLTPPRQRAILHRARARVRDRLDRRLARDGDG